MRALASGDLNAAKARMDLKPVTVYSHDEVGDMAASFNLLQREIADAAIGLEAVGSPSRPIAVERTRSLMSVGTGLTSNKGDNRQPATPAYRKP